MMFSKRLGYSNQIADEIATAVWNEMKSKVIRDVLSLAKLLLSNEDISWMAQVIKKYGGNY